MAEPTAAELAAFRTCGQVASWAELPEGATAALFGALGVSSETGLKGVGSIREGEFSELLAAIQVDGQPLTPVN